VSAAGDIGGSIGSRGTANSQLYVTKSMTKGVSVGALYIIRRGIRLTGERMAREKLNSDNHSEPEPQRCGQSLPRVFLLSPANTSAIRGRLLMNQNSEFELAQRIRRQGVPLGELFSFISSLYFRGKLAYAKAFSNSQPGLSSILVMTSSRGLLPPETVVTRDDLVEMSSVPIDPDDARYREPLCRDARALASALPALSQVVLLGSIASRKYIEPLLEIFGADLLFPQTFVGRGDMSRGGLMLRCVQERIELDYVQVVTAVRRGSRPAKLSPARNPHTICDS
jgi:hypothetical protein